MSDKTPLEQIRDYLQAVLGINEIIPVLINGVWGEILDDTKTERCFRLTLVQKHP